MAGIFKAYDIRGTVPDQLNPAIAWQIGHAFARFMRAESGEEFPYIVVGRDVRTHGPEIAGAFMRGIHSAGGRVVDVGICTTPMLYLAVGVLDPDGCPTRPAGGAMVTASHNPGHYNGFKLCRSQARPISGDTGLAEIEKLSKDTPPAPTDLSAPVDVSPFPLQCSQEAGQHLPVGVDACLWAVCARAMRRMIRHWPANTVIAVDPANGMGCLDVLMLRALGASVVATFDHLDGSFPNHEANPLKPENMADCQRLVREQNTSIGVAFDGDSDRACFVDEKGEIAPCDLVQAILARAMLRREPGAAILYDLRSSRAVPEVIAEAGGRPIRERVGHSFMKATMRREDCISGGELSGHFYFRDVLYTDNALVAVIELLNAMGESEKPLSTLIGEVRRYAQSGELNYVVQDKDATMKRLESVFGAEGASIDWLDGVTVQFPDWWCNVRPSNTEPLLRLNLEAGDAESVARRVAQVEAIIGGSRESGH